MQPVKKPFNHKKIILVNNPPYTTPLVSVKEFWKNEPEFIGEYIIMEEYEALQKENERLRGLLNVKVV